MSEQEEKPVNEIQEKYIQIHVRIHNRIKNTFQFNGENTDDAINAIGQLTSYLGNGMRWVSNKSQDKFPDRLKITCKNEIRNEF